MKRSRQQSVMAVWGGSNFLLKLLNFDDLAKVFSTMNLRIVHRTSIPSLIKIYH